MFSGNKVICANCGDSRGMMARLDDQGNWNEVSLSNDHKPCTPIEQDRILKNGGRVEAYRINGISVGPKRVWLKVDNVPGLAMSRSIGDKVAH